MLPLLLVLQLNGQNGLISHPDWRVKTVYNRGFIMVHRASIAHLVKGYTSSYEVDVVKPTLGNKIWHHENNFPDVGLSFQCVDFGNPVRLGYAFTAAPFVEIPLNETIRPSRPVLRICFGLTYITKPFDLKTNHKNNAIGSAYNAFVQFRCSWHLKITEDLRLEPGITFSHASNGKAKNPNLGLNVLSVGAGLDFRVREKNIPKVNKVDSSTRVRSNNEFLFSGAVGVQQRMVGTPRLYSSVFSLAYQRNVRNTHKFALGYDLYHDQIYIHDFVEEHHTEPRGMERFRSAVKLGYSYNVGRISFPVEAGVYVLKNYNPDAFLVSRLGIRYYGEKGLVLSFGLRTHFAVAYAFEYGLGYRLYIKK